MATIITQTECIFITCYLVRDSENGEAARLSCSGGPRAAAELYVRGFDANEAGQLVIASKGSGNGFDAMTVTVVDAQHVDKAKDAESRDWAWQSEGHHYRATREARDEQKG